MAAITDPGSAMAAITYPAGSVIDGIGYHVTTCTNAINTVGNVLCRYPGHYFAAQYCR